MLDLSSIRSTAAGHGFEEIQLNEVSRVIAFEKHNPGRCRINIYYTTGTVATCLDHPCSGKTQLFRRNQTLHDIDTIFRNPRHHTGVGYYRNNDTGLWQPVDDQGRQTGTKTECDDARRWRYIHSTQEGFCNESQANQIAAFCKLWNQLRFASGMMTKAEKFNSMSPEKRQLYNHALVQMGCSEVMICEDCEKKGCSCTECVGAWCCLMGVVLSVAIPADGVIGVYSSEKNDSHNILGAEQIMSCNCNDGMNFRHIYSTELVKLERQLRSFPPRIRRELTWWFITKHMHRYEPFMFNQAKFNPNSDVTAIENFPIELYGETYCSNAILRAHHDYGELSYNPMKQGCPCHGI